MAARILIADRDETSVKALALGLEADGHTVYLARATSSVPMAITRHLPHVCLLDVVLFGDRLSMVVKEIRRLPMIFPVRLAATCESKAAVAVAGEAGFDAVLLRPVTVEDVGRLIAQLARPSGSGG